MKKTLLIACLFISSAYAQINIGDIINYKLNDQFEKPHTLSNKTKKLIFTFTKDMGHLVNDFLSTKSDDFLTKQNTQLISDLSSAPGLIKYFFIRPRLKSYSYPILTIEEEDISARYKDEANENKIMVVSVENQKVTNIEYLDDSRSLEKVFVKKY